MKKFRLTICRGIFTNFCGKRSCRGYTKIWITKILNSRRPSKKRAFVLLPRLGCPTVTEYFDITSLPTQRCEKHYYTYTPPATDYDDDDTDKSNTDTGTTGTPTPDPGENPGEDNTGEEPGEDPGENPGGEDPGTDPGEDPGTEDPGDIPTEPTGSS